MKLVFTIIVSLVVEHLCFSQTHSFNSSVINSGGKTFQTSALGMDINIGEPVTGLTANNNSQITQGFLQPDYYSPLTFSLKVFLQEFYNTGMLRMKPVLFRNNLTSDSTLCDTLTIEFHDPFFPYKLIYISKSIIDIHGDAIFMFPGVTIASYFIAVKHRNSLETWSKYPVLINSSTKSFDFTSP